VEAARAQPPSEDEVFIEKLSSIAKFNLEERQMYFSHAMLFSSIHFKGYRSAVVWALYNTRITPFNFVAMSSILELFVWCYSLRVRNSNNVCAHCGISCEEIPLVHFQGEALSLCETCVVSVTAILGNCSNLTTTVKVNLFLDELGVRIRYPGQQAKHRCHVGTTDCAVSIHHKIVDVLSEYISAHGPLHEECVVLLKNKIQNWMNVAFIQVIPVIVEGGHQE
jgi:hypothetical protein